MEEKDKQLCIKVFERVLYTLKYYKDEEPNGHIYYKTAQGYPWICNMIEFTEIEGKEKYNLIVNRYFYNQMPTKDLHQEFFNHFTFTDEYCWWTLHSKGLIQRILFLEKLIKNLK